MDQILKDLNIPKQRDSSLDVIKTQYVLFNNKKRP